MYTSLFGLKDNRGGSMCESRLPLCTHPHNHWSGVYYVDAGHPDPDWPKSGKIEIQDPRERAEMFRLPDDPYGLTAEFSAEAGAMVVWPSWLLHWVNPFYGEGERISIAFNGRIDQPRTVA